MIEADQLVEEAPLHEGGEERDGPTNDGMTSGRGAQSATPAERGASVRVVNQASPVPGPVAESVTDTASTRVRPRGPATSPSRNASIDAPRSRTTSATR